MRTASFLLIMLATGCVQTVHAVRDGDGGGRPMTEDVPLTGDAPFFPDAPTGDAPAFPDTRDGGDDRPVTADVPADADDYTRALGIGLCPQELDRNTAQNPDLRYPRAFFDVPADSPTARPPATFTGRMAANRVLTTPVTRECVPGRVADTACTANTALRIERDGEGAVDLVTSMNPADYHAAIGVGTQVSVTYDPAGTADAGAGGGATRLVVRRMDGSLAVLIYTNSNPGGATYAAEGWTFRRAEPAHCRSREESFCRRLLAVYPVIVRTPAGSEVTVPADGVANVAHGGLRYVIRNRVALARIHGSWTQCADAGPTALSVELWRAGTE